MSAPWSALCTALVTAKNSSLPCITCQSASMPTLRSSGTWVASSSATPPPYAVALTWRTRAPCEGLGQLADPVDRPRRRRRPRSRRGASRAGGRVRARTLRCAGERESRSIYRVMPSGTRVPGQVQRHARARPPHRRRWRPGRQRAGFDAVASSCRSPTAARAPSTRWSRRAAVRVARQPSPDRSAIPSTRSGRCCRGGTAVVEMARASGLALMPARARSVARVDPRHRRADRRGASVPARVA